MSWRRFVKHKEYTDAHFLFCYWGLTEHNIPFKSEFTVCGFNVDVLVTPNVVVEIDGATHDRERRKEKDEWKDEILRQHGFKVLRFQDKQIWCDLDGVIQQIQEARK